jgi:outer membrane receptor protein involved in Fe transport
MVSLCNAQTAHVSIRKDTDIPAEGLGAALQTLAKDYDFQVLYRTELVANLRTAGAVGPLTSDEALTKVLSGTGLSYKYLDVSTVTIVPATATATIASADQSRTNTQDKTREAGKKPSQDFRVAQVDQGQTASAASVEGSKEKPKQKDELQEVHPNMPEILIQGSRIMNVDVKRTVDDVQPYYILDSQMIEQSGATDAEDFLRQRLTMNTTFAASSQTYGSPNGNTSSINLRGLGINETLILIDGRRVAGYTPANGAFGVAGQPDINGIPLAAIERIEVLPGNASAIYGGAAVGGVVNIILKKNFQGGVFGATYENTTNANTPRRTFNGTYGWSFDEGKTRIMLSGHYSDGEPLLLQDRLDLFQRGVGTILQNSPSFLYSPFQPFSGATANISGFDNNGNPTNLTLRNGTPLSSSITSVPPGAAPGSNVAAGFLRNAGTYNLNLGPGTGPAGLQNAFGTVPLDKSLMATVRQDLVAGLEAFAEFSTVSNSSRTPYGPVSGAFFVPSSAPDNPFQQNVLINFPNELSEPLTTDSVTQSVTAGLLAQLPAEWKLELDYTWSRNLFESTTFSIDNAAFNNDLASGAINPFVDTITYPLSLGRYVVPVTYNGDSTLDDLGLRASGPVGSLPWGGHPTLTVGLEHRKEGSHNANLYNFDSLTPTSDLHFVYFGQSQSTNSAYGEALVPLIAPTSGVPLLRSLDLQLAARSERYTVYTKTPFAVFTADGSLLGASPPQGARDTVEYTSTNPTIGLKYKPIESVAFRVSYAKAFLPPTAVQLLSNPTVQSNGDEVTDPTNGQTYAVKEIFGGNPALKPQTSEDWDLGLIWEPTDKLLNGLRVDLEHYKITQPNYITQPTAQEVVSDPAYASRVTRDPTTGRITVVNESYVNADLYKTSGWDLMLDYDKPTLVGTYDLHIAGTFIEHDQRQYTIGSPLLEYVGFPSEGGEGRIKANATLSWLFRGWTVGWTSVYFGRYNQAYSPGSPTLIQLGLPSYTFFTAAQGGTTIPPQVYHTLFGSYTFSRAPTPAGQRESLASRIAKNAISDVTVQFGIKNIFNKMPPFDVYSSPYYYSTYGDPRMRVYWINLRKTF